MSQVTDVMRGCEVYQTGLVRSDEVPRRWEVSPDGSRLIFALQYVTVLVFAVSTINASE